MDESKVYMLERKKQTHLVFTRIIYHLLHYMCRSLSVCVYVMACAWLEPTDGE